MIKNKAKRFIMIAIASIFSVTLIMGGCAKKEETALAKNQLLIPKLNEGLGAIKKNGKYDEAINKWLKIN